MTLSAPQVMSCYFDIGFVPPLAAMQLNWPERNEQAWTLPTGERLTGSLPARFGLLVRRQAEDAYAITLVWDSTYRQWYSLRRGEILASSLGDLLRALGTRLEAVLDQPVGPPDRPITSAA